MNPIRLMREQTGITQQELAARARTSQPTIAQYESGAKSPTLETLERLAHSLDLDLSVSFVHKSSREDQRSLAFHHAIAKTLRAKPVSTIERAKRSLKRLREQHVGPRELFDHWTEWLGLPLEELIAKMLENTPPAREMRQVSPFAGLLSPKERVKILTRFRRDYKP